MILVCRIGKAFPYKDRELRGFHFPLLRLHAFPPEETGVLGVSLLSLSRLQTFLARDKGSLTCKGTVTVDVWKNIYKDVAPCARGIMQRRPKCSMTIRVWNAALCYKCSIYAESGYLVGEETLFVKTMLVANLDLSTAESDVGALLRRILRVFMLVRL